MNQVTQETLKRAYKPFDLVSDGNSSFGFIRHVKVNESQSSFNFQIQYSIHWLFGETNKVAWFNHEELQLHGNMMQEIAKVCCDGHGGSQRWVDPLFNAGRQ